MLKMVVFANQLTIAQAREPKKLDVAYIMKFNKSNFQNFKYHMGVFFK
jgi:hypothetical protein